MTESKPSDLSNLTLLELFRAETENQTGILTNGLLALERDPGATHHLEVLMRAAHSLKGAARIVNLDLAVRVAHALEDCFVSAQQGQRRLGRETIDVLLGGVDLLQKIAAQGAPASGSGVAWADAHAAEISAFFETLAKPVGPSTLNAQPSTRAEGIPLHEPGSGRRKEAHSPFGDGNQSLLTSAATDQGVKAQSVSGIPDPANPVCPVPSGEPLDRVLRLTAGSLNRLLGLAGESLVESRWLRPFADSLQRLKRYHAGLSESLDALRQSLAGHDHPESRLADLTQRLNECRHFLTDRLQELDGFDRRSALLSHRLYLEALRTRMSRFGIGIHRFPRMVRDLARALGKDVKLEIVGENTPVDRDILERLETPLAQLLRNAVDHGCEAPEVRQRAGKPAEGLIRLEARHCAGRLLVSVSDDGAGLDPVQVRAAIVARGLVPAQVAADLSEAELLEFLFLPGFTLKESVTEISGRGVGLDVVRNMVKSVRGSIRVSNQVGRGLRFQLQLPLTLSVLRTLLVEVAAEPYAIPLGQIARALRLPRDRIEVLEGRPHFRLANEPVGLISARQVFEVGGPGSETDTLNRDSALGINPVSTLDARPASRIKGIPPHEPGSRRRKEAHSLLGDGNQSLLTSTATDEEVKARPVPGMPDSANPVNPVSSGNTDSESVSVVVLGERDSRYGLVVDRLLGERELVVQPLDPRLGKVPDISAAALMEDGLPVLIVDVDDLLRSADKLSSEGRLLSVGGATLLPRERNKPRKRVLAVDDSLTVRELERKLLVSHGYLADVAVDGMEGWNAVRTGQYHLVITDVDMPRLDGIELARLIKNDPQLRSVPVLIVSYKDCEEDRLRGLEAGADYYLTKGSFHDENLLQAVADLIGEPET